MRLYKLVLIFNIQRKIKKIIIDLFNVIFLNKGVIQKTSYLGIENTLFNNKSIKKNSKGLYIVVYFFGNKEILNHLKEYLNYCKVIKRYMLIR